MAEINDSVSLLIRCHGNHPPLRMTDNGCRILTFQANINTSEARTLTSVRLTEHLFKGLKALANP